MTFIKKLMLALSLCLPRVLMAEVFYAKDEALKLAFPEAEQIEEQTFVLNAEQKAKVESLAKAKIESNLITFYKGIKNGQLLGYCVIDSHMVRSMYETFMVVLTPEGTQKKVVILAFNEPLEYIASERWLSQFNDKKLSDDLWPGRGVHGIVGSTLTTNALTAGVRKILAMHTVLIAKE